MPKKGVGGGPLLDLVDSLVTLLFTDPFCLN